MSRRHAYLRTLALLLAFGASACTQMGLIGTRPVRGNGQGYDVMACASGRSAVRIFSDPKTRIGTANLTRDGVDKAVATIYSQSGDVRSYASSEGLSLSVNMNEAASPDDKHLPAQLNDATFSDKLQCVYTAPLENVTPEIPDPPLVSIYRFYFAGPAGVSQHFFTDDRAAGLATGAVYEGAPFKLYPRADVDATPLFSCPANHVQNGVSLGNFLTLSENCENSPTDAGVRLGYVYQRADPTLPTDELAKLALLHRCKQATAAEYIQVLYSNLDECTVNGWVYETTLGFAVP